MSYGHVCFMDSGIRHFNETLHANQVSSQSKGTIIWLCQLVKQAYAGEIGAADLVQPSADTWRWDRQCWRIGEALERRCVEVLQEIQKLMSLMRFLAGRG